MPLDPPQNSLQLEAVNKGIAETPIYVERTDAREINLDRRVMETIS